MHSRVESLLTRVGLDAGGDLSGADGVEVGDILAEGGLEVLLPKALRVDLAGARPHEHIVVGDGEDANS